MNATLCYVHDSGEMRIFTPRMSHSKNPKSGKTSFDSKKPGFKVFSTEGISRSKFVLTTVRYSTSSGVDTIYFWGGFRFIYVYRYVY